MDKDTKLVISLTLTVITVTTILVLFFMYQDKIILKQPADVIPTKWTQDTENGTDSVVNDIHEGYKIYSVNVEKDVKYNDEKYLDIYSPNDNSKVFPLVIWFAGGAGESKSTAKDEATAIAKYGYVVAIANYGTTDFTHAGSKRIQNGIEAMEYMYQRANTYKVDINKKIFVGGTSFGGIMASLLGTATNTEEYASVLHTNIGGVLDFFGSVELPTDDKKSQLAFSTVFGCEDPLVCPEADIMRVVKYIDKDDPAFYIVHGQNDGTSRAQQSINLASALSDVGVENKLIIDQELGHDSALVIKYIDSLIDFLRSHE